MEGEVGHGRQDDAVFEGNKSAWWGWRHYKAAGLREWLSGMLQGARAQQLTFDQREALERI